MTTQIVGNLELFSEAEIEALEFLPEELESTESELYPNLESISLEKVAKDLKAYFEGGVEQAGLEYDFHGPIGNGRFGRMNAAQVQQMLLRKYPNNNAVFRGNLTTCINHVMSNQGNPTGNFRAGGLPILHTSSGARNNGCTLFYIVRPNNVANVVGIGHHVGRQSYRLDWVDTRTWRNQRAGRTISLD